MMDEPYRSDVPASRMSDDELAAYVQGHVENDDRGLGEWRQEARDSFDFVAGHQWSSDDIAALEKQRRPVVTFNRVAPMVDAVCGAQVNNRQEIKVLPRSGDDGKASEIRNLVLAWIRDNTDAEDWESEAFRDAVVGGIGVLHTYISQEDDALGTIKIERVDPFEFGWDRAASRVNLSDAQRFWRRRYLSTDYVRARWPEFAEVGTMPPAGLSGHTTRVVGDQYAADEDATDQRTDGITVTHFQWREDTCKYYVKAPLSGQTIELTQEGWDALAEKVGEFIEAYQHAKRVEKVWWETLECGGKIAERNVSADPKQPSYQVITARWDRRQRRYFGLVRAVMDPQRWANKWLAQSMHILNTSAKSGVVVEEGAVSDVRKFEETYAQPGSVSVVRPGGLNAIRDKVAMGFPAGFGDLLQFALAAIPDVTGINREMLGTVGHEQAGILEAQRKQAAQAVLAPLFDSLRRYYKAEGRLLMELARRHLPPEQMVRIVTPEGTEQDVSMAIMKGVSEYDVIVDQAPLSPNQKMEVWQTLQPALPALVKMGMPLPVWTELLRYSPLPESAVQKIVDGLKNQPPPPPDPAMVKAQMDAQTKQQDAQMKAQEMQAQLAMDEKRLAMQMVMERRKADLDMEIERRKAELDLFIAQQKAAVDLDIADRKASQAREIETFKADVNARAQMAKVDGDRSAAGEAIAANVSPLADAVAQLVAAIGEMKDAQRQASETLGSAVTDLAALVRAPREAVRDPKTGRVTGSRVVLQ